MRGMLAVSGVTGEGSVPSGDAERGFLASPFRWRRGSTSSRAICSAGGEIAVGLMGRDQYAANPIIMDLHRGFQLADLKPSAAQLAPFT